MRVNCLALFEIRPDRSKAPHQTARAKIPPRRWARERNRCRSTSGPSENYFLLHGNTQEASRHLKGVLAGSRKYDRAVFNVAWKASGNAAQILQQLIPNEFPAEFS
jgi:hypothetical protein